MKWNNIKSRILQKENVPKEGYMLAYTRKEVIFRKYSSLEELDIFFEKDSQKKRQEHERALSQEILEIHLFDKEKEYRAIASESKRKIRDRELCGIEHIAGIDWRNENEVYKERIMIESAFLVQENGIADKYITVYNHISYEDGMAKVDDYRLVMEG